MNCFNYYNFHQSLKRLSIKLFTFLLLSTTYDELFVKFLSHFENPRIQKSFIYIELNKKLIKFKIAIYKLKMYRIF